MSPVSYLSPKTTVKASAIHGRGLFAREPIEKGEIVCIHDWAMTDDDSYEMSCNCGAATCRGVVTGQDWREPELQRRYGNYMSWYLLEKIRTGRT